MKYSGDEVQKALFTALSTNISLTINAQPYTLPVASHVTDNLFSKGPFITIGEDSGERHLDTGNEGQARSVVVTAWARGAKGREQTKQAAAKIMETLDRTNVDADSISVDGFTVHSIEWAGDESPPVDDDGETYRTSVEFLITLI